MQFWNLHILFLPVLTLKKILFNITALFFIILLYYQTFFYFIIYFILR